MSYRSISISHRSIYLYHINISTNLYYIDLSILYRFIYLYHIDLFPYHTNQADRDCRIHRLDLYREVRPLPQWASWIWYKAIWWWGSSNLRALGNAEYSFIEIAPGLSIDKTPRCATTPGHSEPGSDDLICNFQPASFYTEDYFERLFWFYLVVGFVSVNVSLELIFREDL